MTLPLRKTFAATILFITCASSYAQPGLGTPLPLNPLGDASAPIENPITEQKRVLGKILFWDEQLSSDNTVACGTCHRPATGGADPRLTTNPGFDATYGTADDIIGSAGIRALDENGQQLNDLLFGHDPQVTGRAAPSFFTSMFADSNFWDGRATDEFTDPLDDQVIVIAQGGALESQAVGPILSSVEMAQAGRTWEDVVNKLEQVAPLSLATQIPADMQDVLAGGTSYSELFTAAFSDSAITPSRIAMAIATYERTLVPNETPWDAFIAGDNTAMSADQREGWQLFNDSECRHCHVPPLFSDNNFHNIGLRPANEDLGRFEITEQTPDRGRFKTPSLRNVGSKTALMHLGWITDVSDSFDFYNAGTSDTGHTQFTQQQSNIPNSNVELNEIDAFANDPVQRNKLIDFIVNGLSDSRAEQEIFPFDRPTLSSETISNSAPQMAAGVRVDGEPTSASFQISVIGNAGQPAGTFTPTESIAISARISPDANDLAQAAQFHVVIAFNGKLYALNEADGFDLWAGELATLPSAGSSAALGSQVNIPVVSGLSQLAGTFDIFLGYTLGDGILRFNASPFHFVVE